MRISEVLGSPVLDRAGSEIGVVHDLQVTGEAPFRVTGITVGPAGWIDRAAHAWGFAQGRTCGPWPLATLARRATRRARFAPVDAVASWAPDGIRLAVDPERLEPLDGRLRA